MTTTRTPTTGLRLSGTMRARLVALWTRPDLSCNTDGDFDRTEVALWHRGLITMFGFVVRLTREGTKVARAIVEQDAAATKAAASTRTVSRCRCYRGGAGHSENSGRCGARGFVDGSGSGRCDRCVESCCDPVDGILPPAEPDTADISKDGGCDWFDHGGEYYDPRHCSCAK